MGDEVANPGSDAAREQGCTCPVSDNGYGRAAPLHVDGWPQWYIALDCPLHGHAAAGDNDV